MMSTRRVSCITYMSQVTKISLKKISLSYLFNKPMKIWCGLAAIADIICIQHPSSQFVAMGSPLFLDSRLSQYLAWLIMWL